MKILIVKLSSLGDVLHLFPAISDVRKHYPDAEIHWLVEPAFAEVASWHFAVNKVIKAPIRAQKKAWWKYPRLINEIKRQLQVEKYDCVIDAQGLIKSAVISRLAGAPVYGFASNIAREPLAAKFYKKTITIPAGVHIIQKNRLLLSALFSLNISSEPNFGLEKFLADRIKEKTPGANNNIPFDKYIVLLHGTTWDSKFWPESYWKELVEKLSNHNINCVLPWINENEKSRALRVQGSRKENIFILPKLSLTEMMDVMINARAFISVESGIGHIAAALGIPGIMLHGPTDPEYSGIIGKQCVHLTSGIYCAPCFKRNCPRIGSREEIAPCQLEIKPSSVFEKLQEIIKYG